MPALPAGLSARPLRADDVDAIVRLLAAAEPLDDTGENENADDLSEWLVNERLDLAHDTRAVESSDGELVAWASVMDLGNHRDEYALRLDGRVHPAWRARGIGRVLLQWQLERSRELHRDRHPEMGGRFAVGVTAQHHALERLVVRAGMEPVQHYWQMHRPLTGLPAPRTADGVDLVPYDRPRDEEVRRTHNLAFVDHVGTAERDAYAWRTWFTGQRAFRPELSRLALAGGAVVGYVLVYEYEADTDATGLREAYLGQIGVLPALRGRGVASAAMSAALHAAAADGFDRAGLTVDSQNTTGALRLYEALGFTETRRETVWALRVPAVEVVPVP